MAREFFATPGRRSSKQDSTAQFLESFRFISMKSVSVQIITSNLRFEILFNIKVFWYAKYFDDYFPILKELWRNIKKIVITCMHVNAHTNRHTQALGVPYILGRESAE